MRPLNEKVLILPDAAPDKIWSIVLPDEAKKKPLRGKVVSLALDLKSPDFKIGDTVHYSAYAGTVVPIDGVDHIVILAKDLIGVE